jgi:methyl-accepting chemotaxis protein WspA
MNGLTIRRRVLLSFALIVTLMAVTGSVALHRLTRIEAFATELQTDSLPGLQISAQMMSTLLDNYALVQDHVIANSQEKMQVLEAAFRRGQEHLDTLTEQYARTIARDSDVKSYDALRVALKPYRVLQDELLRLGKAERTEEKRALADREYAPAFEKIRGVLQAIVDDNDRAARASASDILRTVRAAETTVLASAVGALLFALACGYFLLQAINKPLARLVNAVTVMGSGDFSRRLAITRQDEFATLATGFNRMSDEIVNLVGQVQKSGIQVNTSVTQIAATSKEQQATAAEIAATTTEIGATSREIAATAKELVRTMGEVAKFADDSASLAASGQTGLTRMAETMRGVVSATGSISDKLAVLNEKAGNIGQVVTTITRVADQTNLLSLNAAIEAEKAGQYGRGFAVVATEIRRLADQTAVATSDIEQMVKDIQSAVSAGVMGMDRFSEEVRGGLEAVQQVGAQLSQIIQQVQALAPRCEAVNEGMQAQATGAEQITQALTQLSEAAQQTVESLRQSNQAIGELNQVTTGLRAGISRFKLDAGGSATLH